MPRRRTSNHRDNIRRKNKSFIIRSVKNENELMLGILVCQIPESFEKKIAVTLQVIGQQKSCVYGDPHALAKIYARESSPVI